MKKRVYKSTRDKKIFGVCGGLAEMFDIDPTIIRVIWAILIFAYGAGLLAYIICAILFPTDLEVEASGNNKYKREEDKEVKAEDYTYERVEK